MNITMFHAAVMADFTVQREVWHCQRSNDCCEHIVLETFDDERWRAYFRMRHRMFVRLCGRQAALLVCQDIPFRWNDTKDTLRFEQAKRPDCRRICTNTI